MAQELTTMYGNARRTRETRERVRGLATAARELMKAAQPFAWARVRGSRVKRRNAAQLRDTLVFWTSAAEQTGYVEVLATP